MMSKGRSSGTSEYGPGCRPRCGADSGTNGRYDNAASLHVSLQFLQCSLEFLCFCLL